LFIFPYFLNTSEVNAQLVGALGMITTADISHCAILGATPAQSACEAAAHDKSAPKEKSYRNELSEKNRMKDGIPV
jgi:hypothetical protein